MGQICNKQRRGLGWKKPASRKPCPLQISLPISQSLFSRHIASLSLSLTYTTLRRSSLAPLSPDRLSPCSSLRIFLTAGADLVPGPLSLKPVTLEFELQPSISISHHRSSPSSSLPISLAAYLASQLIDHLEGG